MEDGFRSALVEVHAPARLHLGFFDLDGGLGRRFGSLGLAIEGIGTRVTVAAAHELTVSGPSAERAGLALERAAAALAIAPRARIVVENAIPEHVGLGSGTQLGLAVAAGFARLHQRAVAPRQLAAMVARGGRSAIGIGAFEQGGLLVDGGRGAGEAPAPIVARAHFPEDWPILLVLDETRRGLHGPAETAAFRALPPFSEALAGALCRLVLMRLLPGLAERDFGAVAGAITDIQRRLGDYFAPAQGGRFTSPAVAAAIDFLGGEGAAGVGQSSWGPTGFALCETMGEARRLAALLADRHTDRLAFRIVTARNRGADITIAQAAGRS